MARHRNICRCPPRQQSLATGNGSGQPVHAGNPHRRSIRMLAAQTPPDRFHRTFPGLNGSPSIRMAVYPAI
jgi:hypothetical protein